MDKISVNNLRSLRNVEGVSLKPITALVGKNSSGKSSFLRIFPLLKQTISTRTSSPILWYGNNVDFGDFSQSISRGTNDDCIEMGFEFLTSNTEDNYPKRSLLPFYEGELVKPDSKIKVVVGIGSDFFSYISIIIWSQEITIRFKNAKSLQSILVNNSEIPLDDFTVFHFSETFLPQIISSEYLNYGKKKSSLIRSDLIKIFKKIATNNTLPDTINKLIDDIHIGKVEDIKKQLSNTKLSKKISNHFQNFDPITSDFKKINNYLLAIKIPSLIELINDEISGFARSVRYIEPIRARANRYYRPQGITVNDVDSSGDNIHMFLENLSDYMKKDFQKWTKEVFGFIIHTDRDGGHISILIEDSDDEEKYNVTDMGFGYSQIIPIVVLLWNFKHNMESRRKQSYGIDSTLICIEQPELHLHPELQAKLIDVFVKIINFVNKEKVFGEVKIIFETHSETMISRLSYLINKNLISKDQVNVLVFDKVENRTIITESNFTDEGYIENWPIGFFSPERFI
jgi:predicted ATPase